MLRVFIRLMHSYHYKIRSYSRSKEPPGIDYTPILQASALAETSMWNASRLRGRGSDSTGGWGTLSC